MAPDAAKSPDLHVSEWRISATPWYWLIAETRHPETRTFWIGLLYVAIGFVTLHILIGGLILFLTLIWFIVRCVKGLRFVGQVEPYDNVTTWLW